jgi:hypothetical protein
VNTGRAKVVPFVFTSAWAPIHGNAGPRRAVFLRRKSRIFLFCHFGEQCISFLTASIDNQQSKIGIASGRRTASGIHMPASRPVRFPSSHHLLIVRDFLAVSFNNAWNSQDSEYFSIAIFYSYETEIFKGKGRIVFIGSFAKPSGRELSAMISLSNDYSFSRKTRRMFRRLENCVKRGVLMQEGDWELLYRYLMKVAAEKGSAAAWKTADRALRKFLSPGPAQWDPAKGPIELYFERIVDQICRLQAPPPPFPQSSVQSGSGESTSPSRTR